MNNQDCCNTNFKQTVKLVISEIIKSINEYYSKNSSPDEFVNNKVQNLIEASDYSPS